jgi:enediyne biosynthesis protein E4
MRTIVFVVVVASAGLAQTIVAPSQSAVFKFEDISKQAGLTVPHISSPEKQYIIETVSGGVGFIDCDNDGNLDIVTVNGSNVDRFRRGGDPLITLYHQDPDLKFTDITQSAGLTRKGWGMGVAVADYDNDGWQDLYVTGFGVYALYRNLGNCKFQDVTEKSGLRASGFGQGAAWGDYDRDGNVDLFIARYLRIDIDHLPEFGSRECTIMSVKVHCGPLGLPGETNFLFHSRGDGTFEDVTKKAGVLDPGGAYGMQPLWFDYDNDGWPDLYVSNDAGPNYLYHNKHDGTFEDISTLSGAAVDANGKPQGSMGVDAADFDHDGLLDLFVPDYSHQYDILYRNRGALGFEDITANAHLATPTYEYVGWGTGFFDADNDGWPDIFVTNGHVYPQADAIEGSAPYREPIQLFRNHQDRTFEDVTVATGLEKIPWRSWRGAAFGDVNNDGKVDVLVLDADGPPLLLINRTESRNHAALFRLVGTKSNKAAIGARITVVAADLKQFDEVRGGASLFSQNDLRLHFGLGAHAVMDTVEVAWPSGKKDTFQNLAADCLYTIVEGTGRVQKTPLAKRTASPAKNPLPSPQ